MSIQFVQEGDSIDYIPTLDVAAGVGVIQNNLFGVTKQPIKASELGSLALKGVFDFPKSTAPGESFLAGEDVLFDDVTQLAHPPSVGGVMIIGRAVEAAAESDTLVRVKLLY
jgi:predicted RecA/RadA family phage recombinase